MWRYNMTETIKQGCNGVDKWHWYNISKDLVDQGGLSKTDISINPLSVRPSFCAGKFRGHTFTLSWQHEALLMLSMTSFDIDLVNAFSVVVDYKPFVKYLSPNGMITVEWHKIDPDGEFQKILHPKLGYSQIERLDTTK